MILSVALAVSVLPDDNCHVERSVLSCRAKSRHLNINVCR